MHELTLELKSDRLLLRPLQSADLDWCIEMLTDPDVVRYIYEDEVPTVEDVVREMPLSIRRTRRGSIGIWAIESQETGEPQGTTLLLPLPIEKDDTDWDLLLAEELPDCEVEIGYILRKQAWGKGIATEAASRLLRFAFDDADFSELVAVIHPDNDASCHVLTKIGFSDEGLRRAYADDCHGFRIRRDNAD